MKQRMQNSYEKGLAIHSAPSFARDLPRGRPRSVNRGIGGVGIELRKLAIWTPTLLKWRKATWTEALARVPVQSGVVEDPTARLETSCTRTGRPRRRLWRTFTGRTAGEGSGHTARMYVSEESHCGILPMNHSNNDGTLSAESEEGRPRLKENTFPFDTYPTPSGTARVLRVGECADKPLACPLFIYEKNRMR